MTKTWHSKYKDQEKLNGLTNVVLENIEDIYDYFDVKFRRGEKLIFSSCFIHGGDNTSALNLYYNADYRVHFKCRTHQCEAHFGTSLLSMIRGGLSNLRGWSVPGDPMVSFDDTVSWLLDRYKVSFGQLSGETYVNDHQDFCRLVSSIDEPKPLSGIITKDYYRNKVEIPATYYLQRGYSIEVLDDYDVGVCHSPKKPMYNRAMVPIYSDCGTVIIGFTGRSIFGQCKECKEWHDPEKNCHVFPKWRHTKGFEKEKCLYNYWKAKPYIQKTGVIILVESPGNVWRLEEAGVHNSVALFGADLSDAQRGLIDESGALSIVALMDNDAAGQRAATDIKASCGKTYRLYFPSFEGNDIADLNIDSITSDIKPWIELAKESYQ
jgi:hypothetical protein